MQIILIPENIKAEFVRDEADGVVVKYPIKIDDQTVDKFEFRPLGSYLKPGPSVNSVQDDSEKPVENSVNVQVTNEGVKKRGNPNWKKKEDA